MNTENMDNKNSHTDPVVLLPRIFSGTATSEERNIVDQWIASDPENRNHYKAFEKLWNITGNISADRDIDTDVEWKKLGSKMKKQKPVIIQLRTLVKVAASVILILGLSFMGIWLNFNKVVKSPVASTTEYKLPDGTSVTLNADSKIFIRKGFGVTHRSVSLKGEAYFEVAGNNVLAFEIAADKARIRVTGTKFNVKANSKTKNISVLVTEGSVMLYESSGKYGSELLNTGESGTYDEVRQIVEKKQETDLNDIAWKTREIEFNHTTLKEVAEILTNTYHKKITVSPEIENCSVTVSFTDKDLETILNILGSTLDLSVARKAKQIFITGKGC